MRVYINSSGVAPHHDYRWRLLAERSEDPPDPERSEDALPLEESENLPPLINDGLMKSLREEEDFSVQLVRADDVLGLLVTGLPTEDRKDYTRQRRIRNSLACVGNLEEERVIRGIAVAALQGRLATLVDESVRSQATDPMGFEVSSDLVTRLRELGAAGEEESQQPENRLGKSSKQLRQELADEIDLYKLPEREGVLVVVTTLVAPAILIQAQVWRGLSTLVNIETDRQDDHWISLPAGHQTTWLAHFLLRFRTFWLWMSSLSRR